MGGLNHDAHHLIPKKVREEASPAGVEVGAEG